MKNTDKSYIIEVVNNQTADNETSSVTEKAAGSCYERGGKRYIMYKTVTDGETYSTVIIVNKDTVSVKRKGFTESNMQYDMSRETISHFITPYGSFPMRIKTRSISYDFDENGGILELNYISVMQDQEYINQMTIKVDKGWKEL